MANSRKCPRCLEHGSKSNNCQIRFQAPSNRTDLSKGNKPRQASYTYKCPSR